MDMPRKGDLILVSCRPSPVRIYTTNSGVQGGSLDVLVNYTEMLKRSGEGAAPAAPVASAPAKAQYAQSNPSPVQLTASDDLPF